MVMENKRLVMTVITFAGIIAGILLVNRWIAGEMKDLAPNPVERSAAPQPVEKPQQTAKRPRPVLIDPLHDPLAPEGRAAGRSSSQRIYEPAETSVILTQ